ncbi:MAG: hypothetical protein LBD59_04825 [Prevotellaceae bacterium]|jgi:hypothetical protein|nr:hypothetical protein [Prevotellaceae bacterium]
MKKYKYYFLALALSGLTTITVINVNMVLNSQNVDLSGVHLENLEALTTENMKFKLLLWIVQFA